MAHDTHIQPKRHKPEELAIMQKQALEAAKVMAIWRAQAEKLSPLLRDGHLVCFQQQCVYGKSPRYIIIHRACDYI